MKSFLSLKLVLLPGSFLSVLTYAAFCQQDKCPLPNFPASETCILPRVNGKFYTKNIVTDFGADPSGKTNSQKAFECAARFFNVNGGHGKLIIPYGTYLVGVQEFNEPNKSTCPYWSNYGWIGRDLMHLADCDNVQIVGMQSKDKSPVVRYEDGLKLGGFKKDGSVSAYKNNPDGKRFNPPANCEESEKNDTYQACMGTAFYIDNCRNITITNIKVDGNSDECEFGARIGPGASPYEVWSHGVMILNSKNVTLKDLNIYDIGTDGVMIKNFTDSGINTTNYHTVLDNIQITNSGRNNISWVGGNGLTISNSKLGKASTGAIRTSPGASLDIEPELHAKMIDRCHSARENGKHVIINDLCINGNFYNNYIYDDRLAGLLNADWAGRVQNIKARNLKITNNSDRSYYSVKENVIDFDACTITGKWVINNIPFAEVKNDPKIRNSIFKQK